VTCFAQERNLRAQLTTAPQIGDLDCVGRFLTGNPVAEGLMASVPRPGGNFTGTAVFVVELDAKKMEFINELLPHVCSAI
jgi:hypothetical protein